MSASPMRPSAPTRRKSAPYAEVTSRLRTAYPDVHCALNHSTPFELLVATILSAQCTDARVNVVTPEIFALYPTPQALATASLEDVEGLIHSTGFFHAKARSIVGMAQAVVKDFGGELPKSMEELVTLPGVGRKTANVILGVAYGTPGLPVDTHVTRLAGLLKWTTSHDAVEIERTICAHVPIEEWTELGLRLITHGRMVCVARRPRCGECTLVDICPSAAIGMQQTRQTHRPNK